MTYDMTMKKVNIFEAKARLSEYLELVQKGERVVICRRNRPVAELRAVAPVRSAERPLGGVEIELSDTFFEPLPADLEGAFHPPVLASGRGAATVAEPRPRAYGAAKRTGRAKR